jgi:hypothetical protein
VEVVMSEVTQEDRDDLKAQLRRNAGWRNESWQCLTDPALLTKAADTITALQAELAAAQAEIERLTQERDKLAGIVRGWHYLAVGPDEMGDYYTHKQLVKASEPYASPALRALGGAA